jgi:hypothetical protein
MDLCTVNSNIKNDIKTAVISTAIISKGSSNYSIKNWWPAAILASILFLTPCLAHSASSAGKQDLGEERWFEVELIIFAHKDGQALESEKWPEITDLVLPEKMIELGQPLPELPEEPKPKIEEQAMVFEQINPDADVPINESIPMPVAFVMLKDEELQLKESLKKLIKSSKFDPLLHVAWRQPTYDEKHAQTVLLYEGMTKPEYTENEKTKPKNTGRNAKSNNKSETNFKTFETINPRFTGTIRMSVARYLHLAADLVYRTPITQRVSRPIQDQELWTDSPHQALSYPQGPAYRLESWKAVRGFRLKESRRMRSKRIHYLDHPFLGIVALITPVELPKDPEELSPIDPASNISSGN